MFYVYVFLCFFQFKVIEDIIEDMFVCLDEFFYFVDMVKK